MPTKVLHITTRKSPCGEGMNFITSVEKKVMSSCFACVTVTSFVFYSLARFKVMLLALFFDHISYIEISVTLLVRIET